MPSDTDKEEFYIQVGHALSNFQLIEEWLKIYIEVAFRRIRASLPEGVIFTFSSADYQDSALETLLKVFKKLNSNTLLQARLQSLKDDRNFVAHKAILEFTKMGAFDAPQKMRLELFEQLQRLNIQAFDVFDDLDSELRLIQEQTANQPPATKGTGARPQCSGKV